MVLNAAVFIPRILIWYKILWNEYFRSKIDKAYTVTKKSIGAGAAVVSHTTPLQVEI